jgi:hypothetical protein
MQRTRWLAFVVALIVSPAAVAEFSLGGRLSTQGVGLDLGYQFNPSFGARMTVNGIGYSYSYEYDDVEYDVKLSLVSPAVLFDYRPTQGRFRVTGGIGFYGADVDLRAVPEFGTYQVGNTTYTAAEVGILRGALEYRAVYPYLGVGWDFFGREKKGFGFTIDAGVSYIGKPDVTLTSTGTVSAADLRLEAQDIEDEALTVDFFVGFGFGYRF